MNRLWYIHGGLLASAFAVCAFELIKSGQPFLGGFCAGLWFTVVLVMVLASVREWGAR